MKLIRGFIKLYKRIFWSFERQARNAGVKLGRNNEIMTRFWSTEPYLITIGDNCQITNGVKIFTHGGGHVLRDKYPTFDCFGKVSLGDYVYLGNNSMVMPGVSIGSHVIVAAGSVVTKSVPSGYVVGGNPARVICSIEEYESRNMRYNTKSKGMSFEDKKNLLLNFPDEMFIKKNSIIK